MNTEETEFAKEITAATKSHADWLQVMRFGLPQLIENQGLLAHLIVEESKRRSDAFGSNLMSTKIMLEELGLRIVLADDHTNRS